MIISESQGDDYGTCTDKHIKKYLDKLEVNGYNTRRLAMANQKMNALVSGS